MADMIQAHELPSLDWRTVDPDRLEGWCLSAVIAQAKDGAGRVRYRKREVRQGLVLMRGRVWSSPTLQKYMIAATDGPIDASWWDDLTTDCEYHSLPAAYMALAEWARERFKAWTVLLSDGGYHNFDISTEPPFSETLPNFCGQGKTPGEAIARAVIRALQAEAKGGAA